MPEGESFAGPSQIKAGRRLKQQLFFLKFNRRLKLFFELIGHRSNAFSPVKT